MEPRLNFACYRTLHACRLWPNATSHQHEHVGLNLSQTAIYTRQFWEDCLTPWNSRQAAATVPTDGGRLTRPRPCSKSTQLVYCTTMILVIHTTARAEIRSWHLRHRSYACGLTEIAGLDTVTDNTNGEGHCRSGQWRTGFHRVQLSWQHRIRHCPLRHCLPLAISSVIVHSCIVQSCHFSTLWMLPLSPAY